MKILRELDNVDQAFRGGAVAIGNFDGVHVGHARIMSALRRVADEVGGPALVFTFEPHPVRLLRPDECPPPLTWVERKAELLCNLCVDFVVAYPTSKSLLSLSPERFFEQIIQHKLAAKGLVEGPNFRFGRDRAGDVQLLTRMCSDNKMRSKVVPPVEHEGQIVSSSRLRRCIASGDVAEASAMLTAPYRLRGMVSHGAGRGASIGFPTANLEGVDTLLPAHGVYAARANVAGKLRPAAVNIGPNPTFHEHVDKVEAHVIGFDDVLYGQVIEVDFLKKLRDIQPFASADKLVAQLGRDVEISQQVFATTSHSTDL